MDDCDHDWEPIPQDRVDYCRICGLVRHSDDDGDSQE